MENTNARSRILFISYAGIRKIGIWKRSRGYTMLKLLAYFAKVIILQILVLFLIFVFVVSVYVIMEYLNLIFKRGNDE